MVPIGNEAYNRLYGKIRSVNTLLGWGHARVIENLMAVAYRMDPPPVRAISDQFAHDKGVIAKALMKLGRSIELVQRHKAEEDLAVAAASILARNEFVTRLRDMGKKYGMGFPKGASAAVDAAAKEFVDKHGAANSGRWPKCTSAPPCGRRACPNRPARNGKGGSLAVRVGPISRFALSARPAERKVQREDGG